MFIYCDNYIIVIIVLFSQCLYECSLCWVCVVRVPGSDWCWCSDVVRPHYEATTGHYHGLGAGEDRSPATLHWATACTPHLNISSHHVVALGVNIY